MPRPYFQFHLCALAYSKTERDRLEHITCCGLVEAGTALLSKLPDGVWRQKAAGLKHGSTTPTDYNETNSQHVAVMLAGEQLGAIILSVERILRAERIFDSFWRKFERQHGSDAVVRMDKELVYEVLEGKGMAYREFAVLCGLYSAIGNKSYARVTRETIQHRMLGYKNAQVMTVELPGRTDGARPLSLRQINYTLDSLHERKWFARARANERQTYYSIRMSRPELEKVLLENKTYSESFHESRRRRTWHS